MLNIVPAILGSCRHAVSGGIWLERAQGLDKPWDSPICGASPTERPRVCKHRQYSVCQGHVEMSHCWLHGHDSFPHSCQGCAVGPDSYLSAGWVYEVQLTIYIYTYMYIAILSDLEYRELERWHAAVFCVQPCSYWVAEWYNNWIKLATLHTTFWWSNVQAFYGATWVESGISCGCSYSYVSHNFKAREL